MRRTVEQPQTASVLEVVDESRDVCTLWLDREIEFQPGQFIMVWIPRVDEKPYAVSATAPGRMAITVRKRGRFSTRLMAMEPGDRVGVRGPYGKGFLPRSPGIIVSGGCGIVPLAALKDAMPDATLICGAATAEELLFRERFPDMMACTDDGTAGHKGFPTDLLRPRLAGGEAGAVYVCGPEVMMRAVFDLCEEHGVDCQAALERYMKCGFGVCGQCVCGEMLVCQDGPVFDSAALRGMLEFGRTARLKSGRRVSVDEYANGRSC